MILGLMIGTRLRVGGFTCLHSLSIGPQTNHLEKFLVDMVRNNYDGRPSFILNFALSQVNALYMCTICSLGRHIFTVGVLEGAELVFSENQ